MEQAVELAEAAAEVLRNMAGGRSPDIEPVKQILQRIEGTQSGHEAKLIKVRQGVESSRGFSIGILVVSLVSLLMSVITLIVILAK